MIHCCTAKSTYLDDLVARNQSAAFALPPTGRTLRHLPHPEFLTITLEISNQAADAEISYQIAASCPIGLIVPAARAGIGAKAERQDGSSPI